MDDDCRSDVGGSDNTVSHLDDKYDRLDSRTGRPREMRTFVNDSIDGDDI